MSTTDQPSDLEAQYFASIAGLNPERIRQVEDLSQPLVTEDAAMLQARTLYTRLTSARQPMYGQDTATYGVEETASASILHIRV